MSRLLVCNETSARCLAYAEENLPQFAPVVKLTCFFDSENFLLTDYAPDNPGIHMILENVDGNEMHLAGLNCGYGGTGPSTTARLLQELGIPKEKSEWLKWQKSIEITFRPERDNFFIQTERPPLFGRDGNVNNAACQMDDYSRVVLSERTLYLINPQRNNPVGLFTALNQVNARQLEFLIGKSGIPQVRATIDDLKYNCHNNYDWEKALGAHYANLVVRGNKFNIVCYIGSQELLSTIQSVHSCLLQKPFFRELSFSPYCLYDREPSFFEQLRLFGRWMFKKDIPKDFYQKIILDDGVCGV